MMPPRSERLLLARALVHLSMSISRLRHVAELVERRASLAREGGFEASARDLEALGSEVRRVLAQLEGVSERVRSMLELGRISPDLVEILSLVKGLRPLVRGISPEAAASLAAVASYVDEILSQG